MSTATEKALILTIDEPVYYGRLYRRLIETLPERIAGVVLLPAPFGRGPRRLRDLSYRFAFYGPRGFAEAIRLHLRARLAGSGDVEAAARRQGVPFWSAATWRDALGRLSDASSVHCVLVTVTRRVPADALDAVAGGWVNTHCGPLPRYAGLDAPFWCLYHGEPELAVTLHYMDAELDTGPIIAQRSLPNDGRKGYFACVDDLFDLAFELHRDFLTELRPTRAEARLQDRAQRTFFSRPPAALGREYRRRGGRFV